jgi:hypothetical protein
MSRMRQSAEWLFLVALILCALMASRTGVAQSGEVYKVRLTTVPIDASMMARITGSGALHGTLDRNNLTVSGSFSGLRSPATDAKIHRGPKAIRGPAILDLQVSKATSGMVSGTVTLTPEQVEDLKNGRLYIQIDSQGAPEGNLWGWLLK